MPLIARQRTRIAELRDAAMGVGMGVVAVLAPGAAAAQDNKVPPSVQTAQAPSVKAVAAAAKVEFVKPPMPLEEHCLYIKRAFNFLHEASTPMNGEPRTQIDAWIANGCKGDVPVPPRSDPHNVRVFNAAGGLLRNSSLKISIHPNFL